MGKEDVAISKYLEKCKNVWMLADKTVKARADTLDLYFNKYNGQLTLKSFESFILWLKNKGNSIQTIKSRGTIIRLFIKHCSNNKLCVDFTTDIKLPKLYHGKVKVVPIEDAEKAIILGTEINNSDNKKIKLNKIEARIALRFALRTGLRLSELLNLKSDDVLIEEGVFSIDTTKSHRVDTMPLPIDMLDEIKERMDRKYIFGSLNNFVLNNALHRGGKKANLTIRLHMHMLRAIFCTNQFKNKQSMQTIKDLMRHADYSSLAKYSFAQMDERKSALNTNPVITNGLKPEQLVQFIKDSILATGIKKDLRVKANFIDSKNKFIFEVEW